MIIPFLMLGYVSFLEGIHSSDYMTFELGSLPNLETHPHLQRFQCAEEKHTNSAPNSDPKKYPLAPVKWTFVDSGGFGNTELGKYQADF